MKRAATTNIIEEIETPLKTNPDRKFSDVEELEEEVEEEEDHPITNQQKQNIYSLVSDGFIDRDGESADKHINLIKKISTFNKNQADVFIECLKASKHIKTHNILSSRILSAISKGVIHPKDEESMSELATNEYINSQISELVGTFLSYFGASSSLVIIFLYSACSHLKYSDMIKKIRNGETDIKIEKSASSPPIQNADVREEPYGKDNIIG
jgi:hypothetical protein